MSPLRFWSIVSAGISLSGALLFGVQAWARGAFTPLSALGLAVFLAGNAAAAVKVRCPFCRRFLGLLGPAGKFCPHCGSPLEP